MVAPFKLMGYSILNWRSTAIILPKKLKTCLFLFLNNIKLWKIYITNLKPPQTVQTYWPTCLLKIIEDVGTVCNTNSINKNNFIFKQQKYCTTFLNMFENVGQNFYANNMLFVNLTLQQTMQTCWRVGMMYLVNMFARFAASLR